jgi:hypothetical protein
MVVGEIVGDVLIVGDNLTVGVGLLATGEGLVLGEVEMVGESTDVGERILDGSGLIVAGLTVELSRLNAQKANPAASKITMATIVSVVFLSISHP